MAGLNGSAARLPPGGKYFVLLSVHGLVRGANIELGRDADTGGQVKYVVELARALGADPRVDRVDLITRRVEDRRVDSSYMRPIEPLGPGVQIVRLPCGPRRYLRKETLWPYLDGLADQIIQHVAGVRRPPDVIHSHYADAGYVGARVAAILGVPLIHTGHSLGRVKRERLLGSGKSDAQIEHDYNMAQRIEAEELTLDAAALVIASTQQERDEQYALYDNYQPRRIRIIPPGVELASFYPPDGPAKRTPIIEEIERFLKEPAKRMIVALSRPDERKNLRTLLRAYAKHPRLAAIANLVVIVGNRDNLADMEHGPRQVLTDLLLDVDRYDLYGKVAYPKHHRPEDVPEVYRAAVRSHGVFVNPALTEPFGLTLIEAAASGLPVVATADGGPRDILANCRNGVLVDPLDREALASAILRVLCDRKRWRAWSRNGVRGARRVYSWERHVDWYLGAVERVLERRRHQPETARKRSRLPRIDRLLVCDIDNTLLGDRRGVEELARRLGSGPAQLGFAVATGRRIDSARRVLKEWRVPAPDVFVTAVGTEIYYGPEAVPDESWQRHIDYRWERERLLRAVQDLPGLVPQAQTEQRRHKISFDVDLARAPSVREIRRRLRRNDLHANVVFSHGTYLDFLPLRASKGTAIRYLSIKWKLPPERMLIAGDSGNDEEMLRGDVLGVVVSNHSDELAHLRDHTRLHFAGKPYAWGVIEGLEYFDFLGEIDTHDDDRFPAGVQPGERREGSRP
ncbi:MAG TPA: HAD-IIB family hydrolase [Gammaproteobacteria bacterium]|nr:HAD-IIB family hydrolase [Gammaproteobacteria bacterium]